MFSTLPEQSQERQYQRFFSSVMQGVFYSEFSAAEHSNSYIYIESYIIEMQLRICQ